MRKVLVIAYYFPPTGGGGVQRATKFVKYLPSFGWRPVVLTVKTPDFDVADKSLLNDIPPDVKVFKTYSFDPVRWYRTRRYGANSLFSWREEEISTNDKRTSDLLLSRIKRDVKFILNSFVLIPDDHVGWVPFAVVKGYMIVKREEIDVIYATGKPWSSFLIAFLLSLLTGKPYVVDLRDPWVLTPYGSYRADSIRQKLERFWERTCFSHAKTVININEQITDSYIRYYPSFPSEKFCCISHGFDPDDFLGTRRAKNERFTISYVGTFYANSSPEFFVQAVKHLIGQDHELKKNLSINLIGIIPNHARSLIEQDALKDTFNIVGYLPHRESIQYMLNSDVLLLLLNKVGMKSAAQVSTGKLFEYVASRRPILALIPKNTDAARLIRELGAGIVTEPDDVQGIEESVAKMYRSYKKGELRDRTGDISMFSRRELTKKLASILDLASPKAPL